MRNIKVTVRATRDAAGSLDFDLDGTKAERSRLKLARGSGPHRINFDLQDDTGLGLAFDQGDPIWIDEDGPCPPSPGVSTDQLSVTSCTADRLSTVNQNSGRPRELRYQLNFVATDGSRSTCDPIVDNGGGVGGLD